MAAGGDVEVAAVEACCPFVSWLCDVVAAGGEGVAGVDVVEVEVVVALAAVASALVAASASPVAFSDGVFFSEEPAFFTD